MLYNIQIDILLAEQQYRAAMGILFQPFNFQTGLWLIFFEGVFHISAPASLFLTYKLFAQ